MNKQVFACMYHYVRDLRNSRYPEIKGLTVDLFREHIEYLLKNGFKFINTTELKAAFNGNSAALEGEKNVIMTFDDAYIDHYTNVFPILNEYGIEGTFFVPVKAITEHEVLDVNKIHFILAVSEDKNELIQEIYKLLDKYRQEYGLETNEYYFNKLAIANRFDPGEVIFIKRLLQVELPLQLRKMLTDELFYKYVSKDESVFSRELYMNIDQIKCMQRNGMNIGAHGNDHFWLDSLTDEQQEYEINKSLEFLNQIGIDTVNDGWTIGYPYGSYDERLLKLLRTKNCSLGYTTQVGVIDINNTDALTLSRFDANDVMKL